MNQTPYPWMAYLSHCCCTYIYTCNHHHHHQHRHDYLTAGSGVSTHSHQQPHHHAQQDSPRGIGGGGGHGHKGSSRNKGGGMVSSRPRRAAAHDQDDLFDDQQPLGGVTSTRERTERDREREQQHQQQHQQLQRVEHVAAAKESVFKEDHYRKEAKERRVVAATMTAAGVGASGRSNDKEKEKERESGGYVPSLSVLATGDNDTATAAAAGGSSSVKNYPARSPRGLRRSHGAMAGGVGNNRNNGAGGLNVMVVDSKNSSNSSNSSGGHGDKGGMSDSKDTNMGYNDQESGGGGASTAAGAKSPRYYQFNPRDREHKEQQGQGPLPRGVMGVLGHPQPPSGSQPVGPRSQHHRPQQQPLLRNNVNNNALTVMSAHHPGGVGGGGGGGSSQSSSQGPGISADKDKDQDSDYEMDDAADFVHVGPGLGLGEGVRITKSSNLKVDAKKLYERRVGREKLSKQRSTSSNFPMVGPGDVDSDSESKDPGDRQPNHSDYEDNHHEDKATAAFDIRDQHPQRLDRLLPTALSSGLGGNSSRSKAIVASGLNRRVAAIADQVIPAPF